MSFQRTTDGKINIIWVVVEESEFFNALKWEKKFIRLESASFKNI